MNNSQPNDTFRDDPFISSFYSIVVPIIIFASLVTFLMNGFIILAIPLVKNLTRVTRPYLTFVISLVISDAISSFLLGFQLLLGSYLPFVYKIELNICFLLISEAFKMSGIIVTVWHLLVMGSIHLSGVVNPVKFKEFLTLRIARICVLLLWILPFVVITIFFSVIPDEGFQSPGCQNYIFLQELWFRLIFSALIVIPTMSILVLYAYFHFILWRRDLAMTSICRQNIRTSKITFLIVITCICGWLPAVILNLLICTQGCTLQPHDLSLRTSVTIHAIGYLLVVAKSFSDPLIFAFRQANIKIAVLHLGHILMCQEYRANVGFDMRNDSHTRSSKRLLGRASNYGSSVRRESSTIRIPLRQSMVSRHNHPS